MKRSQDTSPYHAAFIAQCRRDYLEARALLRDRNLSALGALAESNALRMHADALAANPPILYWEPPTVSCLQALRRLRDGGLGAWATIDAGPHVVALCAPEDAPRVESTLRAIAGVRDVLVCAPAGGARVVEGDR